MGTKRQSRNTMQDTSIETLHKLDEFGYEAFGELTKEAYQECQNTYQNIVIFR